LEDQTWKVVSSQCIKKVSQNIQSFVDKTWNPVLYLGGGVNEGKMWLLRNETSTLTEIIDQTGKSLKMALFDKSASFVIVDGLVTADRKDDMLFLIQNESKYYIVKYINVTWSVLFHLPLTVPSIATSNVFQPLWNLTTGIVSPIEGMDVTSSSSYVLNHISSSNSGANDVFLTGDAIFYRFIKSNSSKTFGENWALVHHSPNENILSLASNPKGNFAFQTDTSSILLGSSFLNLLTAIPNVNYGGHDTLFYDTLGLLNNINFNGDSSISRVSYSNQDTSSCLYSDLHFELPYGIERS
jgi:hypothetical protein